MGRKYQPIPVSVLDLSQNSGFGRTLERLKIKIGKGQLISEHNFLRCLFSRKLPIQRQDPTPLNNLFELYLGLELRHFLDL